MVFTEKKSGARTAYVSKQLDNKHAGVSTREGNEKLKKKKL